MVYAIFLIETAQTVLITHDAFDAYVMSFGDLNELDTMQNEWLAVPLISAVGTCGIWPEYDVDVDAF